MARILVVDDDEHCRLFMGRVLQDAGHQIAYATNGEIALERVHKGEFAVVVTDLAMPTFNGLRLIQAMTDTHESTPVIAVSGQNADQLLLAEDLGAASTLIKPFEGRRLVGAVERVLREGSSVWNFAL